MESLGDAWAGISTAAAQLVAAGDAGFGLSENGAKPILNAIESLLATVADALQQSSMLEHQPALGDTPNTKIYKPFLATIASDPVQGAIPALKKLQQDLASAHQVIKQAMVNYQNAEQENTAAIKGISMRSQDG